MLYVCPRCGLTTSTKGHFVRHANIKKTCIASNLDVNVSDYMDLILRTKPTNEIINENIEYRKFMGDNTNVLAELNKLKLEYNKLEKEIKELKSQQSCTPSAPQQSCTSTNNTYNANDISINTTNNANDNSINTTNNANDNSINTTNNNTTNNTTNNNIIINDYKKPNTGYITPKDCKDCFKNPDKSFFQMFKKIYFNPKHPENNSIFKSNMRNKILTCFSENKWSLKNEDDVFAIVFEIIKDIYDYNDLNNYELYDKYDTHEKFKKKIDNEISLECYNNRNKKN